MLNRYCNSRRCREAASELVSSLAPLCLPGPSVVTNEIVGGPKLWHALGHRRAHTRIDAHLDELFPEVVLFEQFPLSWSEKRDGKGYKNRSRYDLNMALTVAIVALFMGVKHLNARHDYDLENWAQHFESEAQALQWKASRIRIGILSTYNMPMCALIKKAVKFVHSLEPAVLGLFPQASLQQLDIGVTSADATH